MDPFSLPNLTDGLIRSAAVEDSVSSAKSVQESTNIVYDRVGSSLVRNGMTQYLDSLSGSPMSLGSWSENASTNVRLLAQVGNIIYVRNPSSGTWTTGRTLASSTNRVRYAEFLGYTYTINGNTGEAPQTFNGTTFGSTNVDVLPKGDYIEIHDGRVWIADKSVDKIYYSNVPSSTGLVDGGSQFVYKISPENGEEITGIKSHPRALLVFKQNNIYRVYGPTAADSYAAYYRGTYSQESIINTKAGMFFHHPTGIYKFQYDGQPEEISRPIIDFIEAVPASFYDKVFAWEDGDHVYWNLGDLTVAGVNYKQCTVRYTLSTQVWTVFEHFTSSGRDITCALSFDTGNSFKNIVGVSDGKIAEVYVGKDDLGDAIFFDEVTRWYSITQQESKQKRITRMAVMGYNAGGTKLFVQTDSDTYGEWHTIGTYNDTYVTDLTSVNISPFRRIRFRKSGYSTGVSPIFNSMEVLEWQDEGYRFN